VEGAQLNYWRSGDADVLRQEMAPFHEKYPGIEMSIGLYRPNEIAQRLSAEALAKHDLTADAVEGDLPSLLPLIEAGLIQDVDWEAYGVSPEVILTTDTGVRVARTYRIPGGVAYNTDLVDPAELPDTWEGLIDSKWAGEIIYDPRGHYLQTLALEWGIEKASAWFDEFLEVTKPVPVEGSTASLQQVVSGQHPISTSATTDNVARMRAKGAPIDVKLLNVVPTLDYYSMLVADAAHPNAAACFVQWWVSPEAVALREEIDYMGNSTMPKGVDPDAAVASISTPEEAATAHEFATKIASS